MCIARANNKHRVTVAVECPYCGFVNSQNVVLKPHIGPAVWTCDNEEGGCDKNFVVDFAVAVTARAFAIQYPAQGA